MSHRPRMFYGWWVVATASLGMFFSTGTIVVLSFGVFFKPLSQYFHAGRAAISLAFTLHGLVSAVCVPLIGRLIDCFGARRVILMGTSIFGLVLLSSGLVGASITYLYLFYLALGLVSGTTSPVPYGVIVSRWFDRQRGLALGLMAFGLGLGAIAMPLVAQRLIATFGLSWRDTWHHPTFWLLNCGFFLAGASMFACVLHMPALLTDRGISSQGAAVASSVVGVALLIGRIGAGYLLDRIFAPRLAMLLFGGSAVGIALLLAGSMGKLALVGAFLVGVGMGAEVDIIAYLMSRYFGLRALGTAFGYGFGSYAFGGALGVLLMGTGFDLTHSYTVPLAGFFIAVVLAAGLMTRLGPYRYAAQQAGELPPVVKVHATSHA